MSVFDVLYYSGCVLLLSGHVWIVVAACNESMAWGLVVFVLAPITPVFFVIGHWEATKRPAFMALGGLVLLILSAVVA